MSDNKPLNMKAYGSIPHLSTSKLNQQADKKVSIGEENILTVKSRDWRDEIIVTEKIDGSCCSVAKIDGKIIALTRSGYLANTSPYRQHIVFEMWVNQNKNRFDRLLRDGERAVGEWIIQAHGTQYYLIHEPYIIFDIFDLENKRILYYDLLIRCSKLDFITPRLLSYGNSISINDIKKKLRVSGHGAIEETEGAVWRCEKNGNVDFLAKWVRETKQDGKYLSEELYNYNLSNYLNSEMLNILK